MVLEHRHAGQVLEAEAWKPHEMSGFIFKDDLINTDHELTYLEGTGVSH